LKSFFLSNEIDKIYYIIKKNMKNMILSDYYKKFLLKNINFSELLYFIEGKLSFFIVLILVIFTVLEFYYSNEKLNKLCGFITILSLFQILYSLIILQLVIVNGVFFYFEYEWNYFTNWFKIIVILVSMLCTWVTITFSFEEKIIHWEYYILILLSCVGNMLLVSSCNLIIIYLAIELQGLCFYILASIKTQSNFSTEAGVKYFAQGAVASGIFLLGSSIIYWALGTTNINSIYYIINLLTIDKNIEYIYNYMSVFLLGILLVIISLLMKLAVAPFHMWAPDVYEGVPTSVTFVFAILPKISLLVLLININIIFFEYSFYYIGFILLICGFFSIIIGVFATLYQIKLKRWFAFAGITHIGYIMLMMAMCNIISIRILLFYLIVYIILLICIFNFFFLLKKYSYDRSKIVTINELIIVFESNKIIAIFFSLILLSLIGIPPLIGFYSKYLLFYLFISEKLFILSLILIILNIISGFYYLRLIKKIFFFKKNDNIKGFLKKIDHFDAFFLSIMFFINVFSSIYIEEIFLMVAI